MLFLLYYRDVQHRADLTKSEPAEYKKEQNMAKYTFKDIKAIQNCTPAELKDKAINELKNYQTGYYHKSTANWSYLVYVVEYNGRLLEVATIFGHII